MTNNCTCPTPNPYPENRVCSRCGLIVMTQEPVESWRQQLEILNVKLESLFNDAVRQCLRFVRKEQTEAEMHTELASLNREGLKHIERAFASQKQKQIEEVCEVIEEYFKDLIYIPHPQVTKKAIINKLRGK